MLGGDDGPLMEGSAVPAFAFPEQAAAVLGRAYSYGQWLATQAMADPEPARIVDPDATRIAIDDIVGAGRLEADTAEQQRILHAYGISFAPARTGDAGRRRRPPPTSWATRWRSRRPGGDPVVRSVPASRST